jgi:hypothetical protein
MTRNEKDLDFEEVRRVVRGDIAGFRKFLTARHQDHSPAWIKEREVGNSTCDVHAALTGKQKFSDEEFLRIALDTDPASIHSFESSDQRLLEQLLQPKEEERPAPRAKEKGEDDTEELEP